VSAKEFQRQRRVVSQTLTGQTSIAQGLRRRQQSLTIAILLLSVIAGSLAFAGDAHHIDIGIVKATLPTWAGVLSTIVFALALVELVVPRRGDAAAHEDAARQLSLLQAQFQMASVNDEGVVDSGGIDLDAEYWRVMNSIARIPNQRFLALKAQHMRRIEQARLLDSAPAAFIWAVRLRLRLTDTRRVLSKPSTSTPSASELMAPESVAPPGESTGGD
jgi:hypothetical protein